MNTQSRVRARLAMFATGLAIAAAGTLAGTGAVSAHHPELVAATNCQGMVTFTATAWIPDDTDDPAHRANPQIDITYESWEVGVVAVTSGAFTSGNGYSFSGQFAYPAGVSQILVRATAVGAWGNGSPGGDSRAVWVTPVTDCQETTTTVEEEEETTTTVAETTTTVGVTTTTEVGSEGPTTTVAGPTTTEVASGGPTTTLVAGELPRTGGGGAEGSVLMVACGLLLMGGSIMMTVRRRPA